MSIERSRHNVRIPARPAKPLTVEDEASASTGTNLSSDGVVQCFINLTLGDMKSAVVTPQLFRRGDPSIDADWYTQVGTGLPVKIPESGRFAFAFNAVGSKNVRVKVRGIGGTGAGSSCEIEFGRRE